MINKSQRNNGSNNMKILNINDSIFFVLILFICTLLWTSSANSQSQLPALIPAQLSSDQSISTFHDPRMSEEPITIEAPKAVPERMEFKVIEAIPQRQQLNVSSVIAVNRSLKLVEIKSLDVEGLSPPSMMKGNQDDAGAVVSEGDSYSIESSYEAPAAIIDTLARDTGIPATDLQNAFD